MKQLRKQHADAEQDTRRLAQIVRTSKPGEQAAGARKALLNAVQVAFDARQSLQQAELQQLESDIHRIRQQLRARASLRDKIIEQRANDLSD